MKGRRSDLLSNEAGYAFRWTFDEVNRILLVLKTKAAEDCIVLCGLDILSSAIRITIRIVIV